MVPDIIIDPTQGVIDVVIWRYPQGRTSPLVRPYPNVGRSSLIRLQRLQLKFYDQAKGQSPDGPEAGTPTAHEG